MTLQSLSPPQRQWAGEAAVAVGIDMGGTRLRGARFALDGTRSDSVVVDVPGNRTSRIDALVEMVKIFAKDSDEVGIAIAGVVSEGVVVESANLAFRNVDVAGVVRERTGTAASVINDAHAALLAESQFLDAAAGTTVMITVGTGIGGAIIIDGRIRTGHGSAGEFGHMTVDRFGPHCPCGNRGCWELSASGRAIETQANALRPPLSVTDFLAAAERGEREAHSRLSGCVDGFAIGINAVCAALAPSHIILGGGVIAREGVVADLYLSAAREAAWAAKTQIVRGVLGDWAGAYGAALRSRQSAGLCRG